MVCVIHPFSASPGRINLVNYIIRNYCTAGKYWGKSDIMILGHIGPIGFPSYFDSLASLTVKQV